MVFKRIMQRYPKNHTKEDELALQDPRFRLAPENIDDSAGYFKAGSTKIFFPLKTQLNGRDVGYIFAGQRPDRFHIGEAMEILPTASFKTSLE